MSDKEDSASEYQYSSDSEASYHLRDDEENLAADDGWYSNRPEVEEYSDLDVYEEAATASTVSYNIDPGDFETPRNPGDSDQSDSDANDSDSGELLISWMQTITATRILIGTLIKMTTTTAMMRMNSPILAMAIRLPRSPLHPLPLPNPSFLTRTSGNGVVIAMVVPLISTKSALEQMTPRPTIIGLKSFFRGTRDCNNVSIPLTLH